MSRDSRKAGEARRLGTCLPEHLTQVLSHRVDEDFRLRQAWHSRVAEPLASHVRPVRYTAGLLFLHVDTPAWASRLRHQQAALVARLRTAPEFRDINALRFRVVPPDTPAVERHPTRPASRLSERAARTVAQAAGSIGDPDLRAALERLSQAASLPPKKSGS